ncbi:MAG: FGGY-family carbohydrate kinase [Deinococcales bacterium]
MGNLLPELQEELGLGAIPIVATTSHDTASAVAGIPDLDEKSAYISSGTWSLMGAEVQGQRLYPKAFEFNLTHEGGVNETIRLLKNIGGMWFLQECRRIWQREAKNYSWQEMMGLAEVAPSFKAFINPNDQRFFHTNDMPQAILDYCQQTGQAMPENDGEMLRIILESLAMSYRKVWDELEAVLGHSLEALRIVGGGSQNALLCQFSAEAVGKRVIAGPVEATALGNIIVQAVATGHLRDIEAGRGVVGGSSPLTTYYPTNPQAWQQAYERYLNIVHPIKSH